MRERAGSGRAARRVRVVHQFAQSECGICCSAMILSAYGVQNCVAELRREYETGRDGLGLNDVAALLRGRGMQVRSYRAAPPALCKLNGPLIAYWDDSHLVVVERIGPDRVEIVDPGIGRKTIDADEFAARYSGVVIHAVPGEGWAPARSTERNVWGVFLRQASDVRRPLASAGLLSLLLYVAVLGVPIATQYAVNGFDDLVRDSSIVLIAVILLVPMLTYYAVSSLRTVLIARIVSSLGSAMMSTTFGTLMRLPFKYFASRSSGELMYRMASVTAVRDAISGQITMVALDIGTLLAVFTYLFVRSTVLGGVAAALVAAMVLIAVVGYRPSRAVVEEEIAETTRASSMQLEALASIETLKVTGMTGRFVDEWRRVYARVVRHMARRIIIQGRITSATTALQTFGPFVVLLSGLALVRDGVLDLGSTVAAQALTATALGTVLSLSSVFSQFVLANAQVERLGDIVNQPESELVFGSDRVELDGSVAVTGLGFSYPGARTATLTGIEFSARPGARIAIVGSSGSGKSTLAKLLLGLYPAGSGTISYSGRRLAELTPDSLYDAVGNVPQDVVLSNRTIAENIDFTGGAPDLTLVRAVVEIAALGPDIEAMPLGLHTQIRDLGGSLSGGQRQRVALARALARQPRILVLDEATSSLDAITEEAIASVLSDMRCTQIVIAHRLSTIISADQILVLERGRVVQRGTHRELVDEPGVYRSLVQSQLNVVG